MEYRFHYIRDENELKQNEIANLTDISRGAYANIESEIANVKLRYLLKFCNKLNYSMNYVCKLSNKNNTNEINYIKTIDKKIMAERLRIIEQEQHKLAKDIATELGISKSTYSGYKNPNIPNLIQTLMLKKIATKYHYSMDWIVGRSDTKNL